MTATNGARWWRFDFHSHTPASDDYGKGPDHLTLRQRSPREWLSDYMAAGIDCVAITDHNSGEWIDRLKVELQLMSVEEPDGYRSLTLFPGVEISTNNGIHILALFDPAASSAVVTGLLGAVQYRGVYGSCAISATSSAEEVVEEIAKAGGLSILAHVDGPKGAFEIGGATLLPLLKSRDLHGVEVVDASCSRPQIYTNRRPPLSEVIGSDSHHPSGLPGAAFPGSRFSYIKMGSPTLEGLRLALIDGNSFSILRSDAVSAGQDPNRPPSSWIRSISVSEAKLMGRGKSEVLALSPWLSALVGGRGTGKSSIAHFLRGAFQRGDEFASLPAGYPPRQTFEDFSRIPLTKADQGALTETTKIQVELVHDGSPFKITWMPSKNGHEVEQFDSSSDSWRIAASQEIRRRFQVTILSQNQISVLASGEGDALVKLIDESAGSDSILDEMQKLGLELFSQLALQRENASELKRLDTLKADLEDTSKKLSRLDESENAAILTQYRMRLNQMASLERAAATIAQQESSLAALGDVFKIEADLAADFPENDLVGHEFSKELLELSRVAVLIVSQAVVHAKEQLEKTKKYLHSDKRVVALRESAEAAKSAFDELAASVAPDGQSDPSVYEALVRRRQVVESELKNLQKTDEMAAIRRAQISAKQSALGAARKRLSENRLEFLLRTIKANRFVRIQLKPYGRSLAAVELSFREMLGIPGDRFRNDITGQQGEAPGIIDGLWLLTGHGVVESPEAMEARQASVEKYLSGVKANILRAVTSETSVYGGHFTNFLKREYERKPEFLDRLLAWFPEDALEISYSPQGDGKSYKPIGQASSGQKAAAMLAFLLAYGDEPIIVDQPEDDLDNQLIYDLLVQQIRGRKSARQIIAITHNPNIVVNGDAELIHVFSFNGGQCRAASSGCLQDLEVRDAICQIMEGGKDAFTRRYQRLA